ncbi:hypothetical protein FNV43_RR15147 [Rhamnella rubrinervis]|uniref:Uncharacterized protein n=1 Tax=Rhamnella rubrinervis TaxID=2594499 RepID=A0A8K0GWJ5_9ROSA|nr:hypothetical protein FNV43_RR15147 [Rhamnella rubrinervis]
MEDWSGLHLLAEVCAEVCAQESRDLSAALVPVDFPKKKRSNLIKNKTETTGLKLKVSPNFLGERCSFQLDHGHESSDDRVDCMAKKTKHSVNADSFASSSSSSGALLIHGHGNGVDGDDYIGKMDRSVTATSAAFDSFPSTSGGGVDGVCGDDDNKGKQKQRVTFSLSTVDKDDCKEKKKQRITFCLSSSSTVTTADSSLQEETGPSSLNPPPPSSN